jgi:hypothetical protein
VSQLLRPLCSRELIQLHDIPLASYGCRSLRIGWPTACAKTRHGSEVLRFDDQGQVVEHRDYDNHVERREPPTQTGKAIRGPVKPPVREGPEASRAAACPLRARPDEQPRVVTVTRGQRGEKSPASESAGDGSAAPQTSQADSGGSIPLTRSHVKAQARATFRRARV